MVPPIWKMHTNITKRVTRVILLLVEAWRRQIPLMRTSKKESNDNGVLGKVKASVGL
jgi:hypothetical protein